MTASIWNPAGTSTKVANADNNYKHQVFNVDAIIAASGIFTLTTFAYQVGTESLLVLVNGVDQVLTTDYTETSNTVVTIPGVKLGDEVVIRALVGSTASQSAAASAAAAEAAAASIIGLNPPNLPITIAIGGTGATNKTDAFDALAPSSTKGDIIVFNGADNVRQAIGINGQVPMVDLTTSTGIKYGFTDISVVAAGITANTTLSATVFSGYIPIAMASIGQSVTLPDATLIRVGSIRSILDNSQGVNSYGIRDATGKLICVGGVGSEIIVSLKDNSTPAGVWGFIGNGIEPGLITINNIFPATYLYSQNFPYIPIDNNTSIHFITVASGGFAAFIVDNVGKIITTPVVVSATDFIPTAVFKIDATHVIVFYSTSSVLNKAVVLTIGGASPSYTITPGTPVSTATDMTNAWGSENSTGATRILALSTTSYLACWTDSTGQFTRVMNITVAGNVVTFGAILDITNTGGSVVVNSATLQLLTNTTALLVFKHLAAIKLGAVVITVAAGVCTAGATVDTGVANSASNSTQPVSINMLTATKAIVFFLNTANASFMQTISIAGTVVTWGTSLAIEAALTTASADYSNNNASRYAPRISIINPTTVYLQYINNTVQSRELVLVESAGVLTVMNTYSNSFTYSPSSITGFPLIMTAGEFLKQVNTGTNGQRKLVANLVSGTAVNFGNELSYSFETIYAGGDYYKLASGDYCFIDSYGIQVMKSNGNTITRKGVIPVNFLASSQAVKLNVATDRLVLQNLTTFTSVLTTTPLAVFTNVEIVI